MVRCLPVAASAVAFGLVFGLLAGQKGLSLAETVLMSGLVFAGSAQMLALQLWTDPPAVAALALAALIINLRYVMLTAALAPALAPVGPARAFATIFLTADENWALAIAEQRQGRLDPGFYLGTGLMMYAAWVSASAVGRMAGTVITDPSRYALDFVGTAVFVALATGLFRGRRDLLPWLVAGIVAWIGARVVPGNWYLIAGGLAGSLVGAWRDGR